MNRTVISKVLLIARCCLFCCLAWMVQTGFAEAPDSETAAPKDPKAQFELGLRYYHGTGVTKDIAKAMEWFRKAAEQQYALAQRSVGTCYYSGQGVEKDVDYAVQWFSLAGRNGDPEAAYFLGCLKEQSKDIEVAEEWFRMAVENGHATAPKKLQSIRTRPDKKSVVAKDGNIFYTDGKSTIQLTHSGKDDDLVNPVLSPDGNTVVFTRKTTRESWTMNPEMAPNGPRTSQLWKVNIDGKGEKMLVCDRRGEPKDQIDTITGIEFSPDGKQVYFSTTAWGTSGALRCVNLDGTKEHFVIDANYWTVIKKGEYKGNLIVSRHSYFMFGPSYDWYYIVTPKGKEIGPLADGERNIPWEDLYREPIKKAK